MSWGKKYKLYQTALKTSHEVICLYSYQYNPTELIWSQVKTQVTKYNTFKTSDIENIIHKALDAVSATDWKVWNICNKNRNI